MNNKYPDIIENKLGYFSIKDLPTSLELEQYYSEKYFQNDGGNYSRTYTADELQYFTNSAHVTKFIYDDLYNHRLMKNSLLDVGTGEGFFANYFLENDWDVRTLDYSSDGLKQHNPSLLTTLIQGDIFKSLEKLIEEQKSFNIINLSNVLEHVIDPVRILEKFKFILSEKSILRISVPNDYSKFQEFLLNKNYTSNTWLCPPDHLHYFTFDSLGKLLESLNYEIIISMGEFPIEVFLSNESSSYVKNKDNGKYAHKSRVEVDNFLFNQGLEKYINYYKACAEIGFSRQVVIYVKVKDD